MVLNDRQAEMAEFIKKNSRVSVKKLAEKFYVSEMTGRRDLKEMEKLGYVRRYNGGALARNDDHFAGGGWLLKKLPRPRK